MRKLGLALAMVLSGCGGGEKFDAGTWQVDAWMESDAGSAKNKPGSHMTQTVRLSRDDVAYPVGTVFFTSFYHGVRSPDVRFENGRIHGSYAQPRVDDIAGQTVPISGTYARDRFNVTFEYRVFGMTMRQVVEGKLVEPLA